jgi:hypothetical protein
VVALKELPIGADDFSLGVGCPPFGGNSNDPGVGEPEANSNNFQPPSAPLTITGAEALVEAITTKKSQEKVTVRSLQEIHAVKRQQVETVR